MGPFSEGWTEKDVEAVMQKGDPTELLHVPLVVSLSAEVGNRQWAEEICFALAKHPHCNVRGNAILGLGHIARLCGSLNSALNLQRSMSLISQAMIDPDEYVRGQADAVASDLETFLGIQVTPA